MITELTKLANHLDSIGLRREADYLDAVIRKIADPSIATDKVLEQAPKEEEEWMFSMSELIDENYKPKGLRMEATFNIKYTPIDITAKPETFKEVIRKLFDEEFLKTTTHETTSNWETVGFVLNPDPPEVEGNSIMLKGVITLENKTNWESEPSEAPPPKAAPRPPSSSYTPHRGDF